MEEREYVASKGSWQKVEREDIFEKHNSNIPWREKILGSLHDHFL